MSHGTPTPETDVRTILVPYDGSPASRRALEYACAGFPSGDVVALHVVDQTDDGGWVDSPDQVSDWATEERERARDEVFAAAHELASEYDREISTAVAVGPRTRGIVDYWQTHDVDFLVTSVRDRGLRRLLDVLTGDPEARFELAPTLPAVLVREDMARPRELPSEADRRVLVPFDMTERSRNALAFACSQFPDADVTALCMYVVWGIDQTVLLDEFDDQNERMTELLATVDRIAAEHDTTVDTAYGFGALDSAVHQYLAEHDVDLVVAGTFGRATISELTMPSAAGRLVRDCPVPLAVVPTPRKT
jgi:nucleotide-binding universal stress UspA family protein